METNFNKEVIITDDNKLFFGDMEIGEPIYNADGSLRSIYVVRVWNDFFGYYGFVCGLDLMPDGTIWVGDNNTFYNDFNSVKSYFNNVCEDTRYRNWKIVNEEIFGNESDEES